MKKNTTVKKTHILTFICWYKIRDNSPAVKAEQLSKEIEFDKSSF